MLQKSQEIKKKRNTGEDGIVRIVDRVEKDVGRGRRTNLKRGETSVLYGHVRRTLPNRWITRVTEWGP